jgi:Flp pilus assembly protein TadD
VTQTNPAARTGQPAAGDASDPAAAFARADVLVELRRPDEAVALLRDALAVHSGRADLWGQLAMALLAAGRPEEAHAAVQRRLELAPHNEWGYRLASLALSGLGRRAEASVAAQTSVRLAPHEWRAHARLARAFADEGRPREAWDASMRAVELAPEEPEAHMAVGAVAMALQSWPMAGRAYRHVLSLEPANAAARNNLALVTLRRGEVTDAASGFADAVAADPRVDVARRNLEIAVRVVVARLLRWQFVAGMAGFVTLRGGVPAWAGPVMAGVLAGALVGLSVLARLRWRALPGSVRDFARSLARTRRRFTTSVGLGLAGYAALAGALPLALAGQASAAGFVCGLAAVCTAVAGALAARI